MDRIDTAMGSGDGPRTGAAAAAEAEEVEATTRGASPTAAEF
jgi:hypothetical protein